MSLTVLTTKLYAPPPRPRAVKRTRLLERLNTGADRPLTLVSAPAGFGKTTLVSDWAANRGDPVAWVSLDEADSEPSRFLTYLVAALRTLSDDTLGQGVLTALQAQQQPPIDQLMAALVNDLVRHGEPVTLILDDYHRLDSKRVDAALAFLLDHALDSLRLVIVTREDPPLPLGRLRARGQLSELRAADLRFNAEEAADFLNRTMGLALTGEDIAALEDRTEGWVAGLQLAAISIQDTADPARLIRAFSGSHQYVLDYLLEEVLNRQEPDVQSFLLRTSVLDRFCAELCDACLGTPGPASRTTLDTLEQANLFLIPLDTERRWYRYHHLFADLLRQRLRQVEPANAIANLHRRASHWFARQGWPLEAFQQAVTAGDIDLATVCIIGDTLPLHMRGEVWPVLDWVSGLAPAELNKRPVLWVIYASALMMVGRLVSIPPKLEAAEAALAGAKENSVIRNLHGHIAAIRAFLAVSRHDVDDMRDQSRRALDYLDPDNLPPRTGAQLTLGHAHTLSGNRVEAMRAHAEALSVSRAIGHRIITILAMLGIGNLHRMNNQLAAARDTYERLLDEAGDPPWPIFGEAHLGLAWVHYQWNDLAKAGEHLRLAEELAEQFEHLDRTVACDWLGACLAMAGHDAPGALAKLVRTRQFARNQGFLHHLPDLVAEECRVRVRLNDDAAAAELAEQAGSPVDQARVALARGDEAKALSLLEAPYREARANHWVDRELAIRVLQALAHHAAQQTSDAFACLKNALTMAEPDGFVRLFLDEGPAVARLLAEYKSHGQGNGYVDRILAAFKDEAASADTPQPLQDPLSQRELAVLGLIADGHSNQAISERLFLALSTVKGYNQRIFDKLGVKRRTEAVARARDLGLLN